MRRYSTTRYAIAILLVLLLPSLLFAAKVRWEWTDAGANYYRWQLDGEEEGKWIVVDGDVFEVVTKDVDPEAKHNFYLQSSLDGEHWSVSAKESYGGVKIPYGRKNHFGARFSYSPYSLNWFDFYNGHEIEGAKYLTYSNYATSLNTELYWKTNKPLSFYLDAGYAVGIKGETIIPKATDVHFVRLGGGIDFALASNIAAFYVGVNGGEFITFNANGWNPATYLGGRALFEFNITEKLLFGFQTRFAISYQNADDPLMRSHTWLLDPVALTLTCRF